MIVLDNVSFAFGATPVLDGITTAFEPGELVGIIGPSGSGKTTLLRVLIGELTPFAGSIRHSSGASVSIGYVPQLEAAERTFPITVLEMVLLGAASTSSRRPWFSKREQQAATAILDRLGVADLRHRRLDELSGGQMQRCLIARALMSGPELLVLDEPTSGIDLQTRQQVLELVHELATDGYTVLLTTHDLNWVASRLPRIICLNKRIIADGSPADVITEPVVRATYGAAMDVFIVNGRPVVVDTVTGPGGR